ncbi:MAG: heme-binding protein [Crocinitomicaceae bacterium]
MKPLLIIFLSVFFLIGMAQVFCYYQNSKTERVHYTVIKKYENFEIRYYPELVVATTVCGTGNYENNAGKGFRKIAGYIFGGNKGKQQIAMTSPVKMTLEDTMKMSFYMPPEYEIDDLPEPSNTAVKIDKDQSKIVAAIQFGGWASQKDIDFYKNELITLLKKNKLEYNNDFAFLGYNAPYEMLNRRNEVIVSLKNYPHP